MPTLVNPSGVDLAAATRMSRGRSRLLLDQPFFGALALRLKVVPLPGIGLMAVDGTHLFYDPTEVMAIPERTVPTIVAHEVLHCALQHLYRVGARDRTLWNIAADHVINLTLEDANFPFPPAPSPWQGLREARFRGMHAEQVYAILREEATEDGGTPGKSKGGQGQAPKGWTPDMKEPPAPSEDDAGEPGDGPMTAEDWKIATEQAAMVAQKAGKLPGDFARLIQVAREPRVDWREVLKRFVQAVVPSDYTWAKPNRRFAHQGLYLPGIQKDGTPFGVVAVDTSGSISQEMLNQAAGELSAILTDTRPERLEVIYVDTRVAGHEVFRPDEGPVQLDAKGGGGTMFGPAFEWVAQLDEAPAFLIYLTDLYGGDVHQITDPGYPVLWATTCKSSDTGPFGETIRVEEEG